MTYEYPGYYADRDRVAAVSARLQRVSDMLSKMSDELAGINVQAVGGDGDVRVTVNHAGQLESLSLATGCTTRYTHTELADLLNETLAHAVAAAVSASDEITGADLLEQL